MEIHTKDSKKAAFILEYQLGIKNFKWFKPTMADFAGRFSDPFLQKAFPLLEYSMPDCPFFLHLVKHASGYIKDIAWPIGASVAFAGSIAKQYEELGGKIHYKQKGYSVQQPIASVFIKSCTYGILMQELNQPPVLFL